MGWRESDCEFLDHKFEFELFGYARNQIRSDVHNMCINILEVDLKIIECCCGSLSGNKVILNVISYWKY